VADLLIVGGVLGGQRAVPQRGSGAQRLVGGSGAKPSKLNTFSYFTDNFDCHFAHELINI